MKTCLLLIALLLGFIGLMMLQNPDANTCISPGQSIVVNYDDINGPQSQHIVVGADFGILAQNKGNYACMGQCGGGCSQGPWLLACLSHDICSFNKQSTGFVFDKSCGDEAAQAVFSSLHHGIFSCPG